MSEPQTIVAVDPWKENERLRDTLHSVRVALMAAEVTLQYCLPKKLTYPADPFRESRIMETLRIVRASLAETDTA